jgi:hypothetical protein
MKDQLITLETAKLIPNPKLDNWWNNCEWFYIDTTTKLGYFMTDRYYLDTDYPRPTQSLLQHYIREIHNIHIEILLEENSPFKQFYYRIMNIGQYFTLSHGGTYNSNYETILEIALDEALNLIKK